MVSLKKKKKKRNNYWGDWNFLFSLFRTISKDRKISYERQQEQPPEFVIKPRRQFVNEGQSAKFKASFEGSRSTVLTWSKDGKVLHSSRRNKVKVFMIKLFL